MTVLAKYGVLK